ncbi:MAG: FHA domain-containing protein [Bifidobacterium sp.]|jgi:hypothetical protein|nr:FHA domain-containing protein [Bifidobacterium sp.]MCH4175237.1 FHA domain-containing protein [Bifidobacterium sp.]
MTELTFAILKYGFLALLWLFVWLAIRSLHKEITAFSPRPSRARRRREKAAREAVSVSAQSVPAQDSAPRSSSSQHSAQDDGPTLLVVIDGPIAGVSVPLGHQAITLGRAASNTMVLDDEFVSSHHASVAPDSSRGCWVIHDLHSTNGTVVDGQRISEPTVLEPRVPVRIGATTFELR